VLDETGVRPAGCADKNFSVHFFNEVAVGTKANSIGDFTARCQRNWLRGLDLNQRPSGYEPDELPDCSTPRFDYADRDDEIKLKNAL
jgi:hypothetical protein